MMPSKRVILEQICVFQRKTNTKKKSIGAETTCWGGLTSKLSSGLQQSGQELIVEVASNGTYADAHDLYLTLTAGWIFFPPLSSFSCNNGRQGTNTARPLALRVGEGHGVRNIYHSTWETLHSNTLLLPCCEAAVDLDGFMEFGWGSSTTCGATLPSSKARFFLAPAAHLIKYRNSRWGKCNLVFHCAHQDAGLFALFPSGNGSCKKLNDSRTTFPLRQ